VAALMGGALAATSQAAKTTTRAAINTSPEPFSNIAASLVEDGLVVAAMWLATEHPAIFGIVLLIVVVLMVLLIVTLLKFLRAALQRLRGLFASQPSTA
jgi:high-affinity Fe2+/Pb2+ permease